MSVTIGNASINEFGQVSGGQPGDQTRQEVWTRPWYANGWTQVCRPLNSDLAERIASAMEAACANDHIGYSQSNRLSLNSAAKAVGYDISAIKTDCECDCSSLVAVCCIAAGCYVSPSMYTGNEVACLKQTGKFEVLTDKKYLNEDKWLKRGDVLVKQYHHTAIVLSDGECAMPEEDDYVRFVDTDELNLRSRDDMSGRILAKLPFASEVEYLDETEDGWTHIRLVGYVATQYLSKKKPKLTYVTIDNLNLRLTPSMSGKVITTMPKGTAVQATGNTEQSDGVFWRQVIYNTKSGWCSSEYLV